MLVRITAIAAVALVLAACAPAAGPGGPSAASSADQPRAASGPRTMTMVVRYEVNELLAKIPGQSSPTLTRRMFNAAIALVDGEGNVRPYLAERLPALNTDSWRVMPDGRMETTYTLRPGLTWHDGAPLTANDFVFAWRVYSAPALAMFSPQPQDQMEEVSAPNPQTLVIRWKALYPNAGAIVDEEFEPIPRHILSDAFASYEQDPVANRDAFVTDRYWSTEFVGAGPFRLTHWEPGSHLEGAAFDGHALGRPRIDRVIVRVIGDENTTLSNMLAGSVQFTARLSMRFEHAMVLKREWATSKRGVFELDPSPMVAAGVQQRPDYLKSPPLLDLRVRRALAHTVDKESMDQGLFDGEGIPAYTIISPLAPHYREVERAITKYAYDPRRSEQLLNEAGFSKDAGGMFASASGERFQPPIWVTAGPLFERQLSIMVDTWRQAGIDAQGYVIPVAETRDNSSRVLFPGMLSHGISTNERQGLETLYSGQIPTAANRWRGANRPGWSNAEYDRLWESFNTTLERPQRIQIVASMMKVLADELPYIPLFYNISVQSWASNLRGPTKNTPETLPYWNIHEWELT
jgi:peptide/nickel transport system substrate-binding protein